MSDRSGRPRHQQDGPEEKGWHEASSYRLLQLTLSPTLEAPGTARRAVVEALSAAERSAEFCDVAELLVSELVTNAVRHATGGVQLDLSVSPPTTRVTVFDHSAERPVVGAAGFDEVGGRGLLLVESLADQWGWEPRCGGKQVWFELRG